MSSYNLWAVQETSAQAKLGNMVSDKNSERSVPEIDLTQYSSVFVPDYIDCINCLTSITNNVMSYFIGQRVHVVYVFAMCLCGVCLNEDGMTVHIGVCV